QFPWFSERHDPETRYDPWSAEGQALLETESTERLQLMWHQAVGVYRILSNLFEHKQMLVMDEVGVGKTIQAIGSIAMYRYLQLLFEENKTYPESFGKWLCTDFFKSDCDKFYRKTVKDAIPVPKRGTSVVVSQFTLFSQERKYAMFVFDEAHYARTYNILRVGTMELSRRARMTVALTATP
ncbi:hypothetical protein GY45DRAFT_1210786, partial [Cubamyces sp. BRFM 1775]